MALKIEELELVCDGRNVKNDKIKAFDKKISAKKRKSENIASSRSFFIFRHPELLRNQEDCKLIDKNALANKINYLHFSKSDIFLHIQHLEFRENFLLRAYPQPILGDFVVCNFPESFSEKLKKFLFLNIIVFDENSVIISPANIVEIDKSSVKFKIPEKNRIVNERQYARYACSEIEADLYQNAFSAKGKLIDFNPFGFRIEIYPESTASMHWFNPDASVTVCLRKYGQLVLSSSCRCLRVSDENSVISLVLAPIVGDMKQFQKKKLRNPRIKLAPYLEIIFNHPFLEKRFKREVFDISTSGFSVLEKSDEAVFFPGMILRDFRLNFAGVLDLDCMTAQVVYCKKHDSETFRCGLSILDMDIQNYSNLNNILGKTLDKYTQIAYEVDLEELWRFLFETGFLYPDKYNHVCLNPEEFKKTYGKLYGENPEIARHFTYQKDGLIYGHISLIRAYGRTWMFQHLAAKAVNSNRSGMILLKQVNHYTNELYRMPSAKLDYLMCYYRPENRFSKLIFGGFAKDCKDRNICAEDIFAYSIYSKNEITDSELPQDWELRKYSAKDYWEFSQFYTHSSGGLLLNVLQLSKNGEDLKDLEMTYERLGLCRKTEIFSLFNREVLCSLIVVNYSNLGFNLSDLLNSITFFVCRPLELPESIFKRALGKVMKNYKSDEVPVLVYPDDFCESMNLAAKKKKYVMWSIDARHVSDFMEFTKRKFKIRYW